MGKGHIARCSYVGKQKVRGFPVYLLVKPGIGIVWQIPNRGYLAV